MESKNEQSTVSGFVGTKHNYNKNPETQQSVISLTIKPKEGDWIYIKAFNRNAEIIRTAIEKEDIKKLTITGKWKDGKPYENAKGEQVNYKELVVDSIIRHKTVEMHGVIAKVDEKITANKKPYTHLFVKNNIFEDGIDKVQQFNVTVFPDTKKHIPKDVEFTVGKPIAVKGEVAISSYIDKDQNFKESTNLTAWNVDKNVARLKEQIKDLQTSSEKAADKKTDLHKEEVKTPKKQATKKQDPGISM